MSTAKSEKHSKISRYFFQIKLLKITTTQSYKAPIKISLLKGIQKLDEIKEPIEIKESETDLQQDNTSLNFYTTGDEGKKLSQYRIIVETIDNTIIGETAINVSPLIQEFMKRKESQLDRQLSVGETLKLSVMIFIEKSKEDLSRSVRSYSETNSVYKFKTQPNKSTTKSIGFSKQSSQNKDVRTKDSYSQADVMSGNNTGSSCFKLVSEQKQNKTNPLPSKVIYEKQEEDNIYNHGKAEKLLQMQDDFDSISMIQEKRQSKSPAKMFLVSGLVFLGLLCYFIITIEDQKHELSTINKILYRTISGGGL